MVREGRVFISVATDPDFASNYSVTAFEVGAQVTSGSSGTTATVRAGHGFAVNDKFIVGTDATKYNTVTAVNVDGIHLTITAMSLSAGDLLVNLGADSGISTPNYNSPGLTIYTDMAYGSTATNNTVTTDAYGKYRYYHKGIAIWELVRNAAGPVAIYTDTDSEYFSSTVATGEGVFAAPVHQNPAFPATFASTESPGIGFSINKSSSNGSPPGLFFFHDGQERWALGEDYRPGDRSYFGWWGDKVYPGSGSWGPADNFGQSWGGAETSLPGNAPRITAQPGVDGPKWHINGSFVPPTDPQTYSGLYTLTLHSPTLQTGSADQGVWAALFETALYGTGVPVDFPSGGIQLNVSRDRCALNIINLSATQNTRCAYMAGGKSSGAANGFSWGVDIGGNDTQNWAIIDHVVGGATPRFYISPAGDFGFNTAAGTQFITSVRTQNAESCFQIENASSGNTAATGAIFASYPAGNFLHLRCYGSGIPTYGGHSAIWAGAGSKLYLGSNNLIQHYIDATAPGTFVMAAATTAGASIRLAHGAAPSSPVNGDMWTTTAGLYVRINDATVGPLS